jgi:hypothetical protein
MSVLGEAFTSGGGGQEGPGNIGAPSSLSLYLGGLRTRECGESPWMRVCYCYMWNVEYKQ